MRADAVVVVEGLAKDFLKKHRKDLTRAQDAWAGLVSRGSRLLNDTTWGEAIPRRHWPRRFGNLANLWLIPELPHRFRAVYTVYRIPGEGIVVTILWIGDHHEYDSLFGYRTS